MSEQAIQFAGKTIELDRFGHLAERHDWSKELAQHMAAEDHLTLTENHWQVINLLRDYYDKHDISPPVRVLVKNMGKQFGKEKANSRYLYDLFPYGPAKQACKYAGLPRPTGCI